MASTEDRLRNLIGENLEVDGKPVDSSVDFGSGLTELGVSSLDLVSFARVVQTEFGISFAVEDCTELKTLAQLVDFIDAKAA